SVGRSIRRPVRGRGCRPVGNRRERPGERRAHGRAARARPSPGPLGCGMSQPAAIKTTGLTKYYGRVVGVDGLSLEVEPGGVFGFLGANGAGKTTTIRLLLDLLRPTSGTASVMGFDCQRQGLEVRRRLGYLPAEMPMYPELTGAGYLEYLAALGPAPSPSTLQALFRRFDISDLDLRRRMRDYSHGMKRKLGLVQALMGDPPLLVLDEPT